MKTAKQTFSIQFDDEIKSYAKKIAHYPELSLKEEMELARLAKSGDKFAKNALVKSNLKIVLSVIKSNIHKSNIPVVDLIQEGNMALIASVEKFNPDLGYKFATYATWWVKQAIFKTISEQGTCVKIPVYVQETLSKYNKMKNKLEKQYGVEVKKEDICEKIKVELNKIDTYLNAFSQSLSLNSAIDFTKENSLTFGDIIEDKKNNLEEQLEQKALKADINYVINLLNPREKDVIKKRYLIGDEFDDKKITLDQIGKEYGVTKECIRQIEKKVINKIKNNQKIKELLSNYI